MRGRSLMPRWRRGPAPAGGKERFLPAGAGLPRPVRGLAFAAVLASALLVPFSDARPQEARQSLPSSGQLLRAEGILRAVHEAALSAGVAEPIVRMPFKPGMAFRKGDVLVAFDCGRLRARLEAARARERALSLKAEAKRRLLRHMAAGKLDARVAEAEARQASAEAEAVAAEVTRCEIRAPWDGQVAEWFRHPHETPQAGERVLAIVASAPPEVDMIVPAAWLSWLRPGKRFQFRINALGVNVGGRVIRIGAVGDAVSQTVRITGRLQDAPPQALPGMGGTAMFGRGLALRGHDGL